MVSMVGDTTAFASGQGSCVHARLDLSDGVFVRPRQYLTPMWSMDGNLRCSRRWPGDHLAPRHQDSATTLTVRVVSTPGITRTSIL